MSGPESFNMLITGGGTGGHLFPGVAVAEAVRAKVPRSNVLFVGTSRILDAVILQRLNVPVHAIKCRALMGTTSWEKIRSIVQLPFALLEAMRVIRRFKPDVVFGVGGYVTGPVILAARLLGIPTCIHEQNSIPGLTNRILARVADRICLSLPASMASFPAGKTVLTGNPVRHELKAVAGRPTVQKNTQTLLVLGGSQGAHRVNMLMIEAMELMQSLLPRDFRLVHQTGADDVQQVRDAYSKLGIPCRVEPFIHDMAEVYQQADLVVSRAGATTLAELTLLRKPAILIPYPYAADNHQEVNGRYLVDGGGARLFRQDELTAEILKDVILELLPDKDKLQDMAMSAGRLAITDAEEAILQECFDLAGLNQKQTGTRKGRPVRLDSVFLFPML